MIAGSTALADARIVNGGQFYPGIDIGYTSMVHLWPILAMVRRSGLPCFAALGFVLYGFGYPKHPVARLIHAKNHGKPLNVANIEHIDEVNDIVVLANEFGEVVVSDSFLNTTTSLVMSSSLS